MRQQILPAASMPWLCALVSPTHARTPTKRNRSSGVKLVILDEADHLTNDAQFALRRVIEKYTKNTR